MNDPLAIGCTRPRCPRCRGTALGLKPTLVGELAATVYRCQTRTCRHEFAVITRPFPPKGAA